MSWRRTTRKMADLYRVMVHDPSDVGWEDDSFAAGWTPTQVDISKDGDIVTLTVQAGLTYGYIEKTGLSIDASAYLYMIVCLKGDGDYRIAVYDGAWKDVQVWASSPTDYDVKIYDLSSVTTGTVTAVRLYVGQAEGKTASYDFVAFTRRVPQFLQDVVEVRVHQRESDLDTFEMLVDSKGPVGDDTVLLMHFDEGLGSKTFDESGYENHGTIYGATWTDGKRGKALSFDGVDDYVEAPLNMVDLISNKAFTVEAWVYWKEITKWGKLISTDYRQDGTWSYPYVFFTLAQWDNSGNWESFTPAIRKLDATTVYPHEDTGIPVNLDEWTHVVGRTWIEGTTVHYEMWLNGELSWSKTVIDVDDYDYGASDRIFLAVRSSFTAGEWGNCIIDEVRIHNRALSADEVEQSYRRGLPRRVLVHGRHIRIWLNALKVFAGIVEEVTPGEGGVIHASGRCFGQKLLLKTKSVSWSGREVSQAVKDLVADIPEITTYGVESPSPTVYVTKDIKYEYIMDGLKDLAHHVGEGWEVKLGMGHDLRFRSRNSSNVPTCPTALQEGVNVLKGVRRESDALHLYNRVVVIGGARSNPDGDPDAWTDQGDASNWATDPSATITEDESERVQGYCSIKLSQPETPGIVAMYLRRDLGASGVDLTPFEQLRFHHKTDTSSIQRTNNANWTAEVRLTDTNSRTVSKVYLDDVQPPQSLAEVTLNLSGFSGDAGFDWSAVRYLEFRLKTDDGQSEIWGNYWIDKVYFHVANVKAVATDSNSSLKHTREYILRDERLTDPDFVKEVADALLTTLRGEANRIRVPTVGTPELQAGQKVTVDASSHGLNGTYYIAEVEHRLTSNGLVSEVTLERPALTLEVLLAESITRRISLIERGGIE